MSQSFDPASPARWLIPLRRLSLLHEALKSRQPVRATELAEQPWWAEQSRRNWRRDLQQLAALGAPLTYKQEATDVVYQYTGRWDLWGAIKGAVKEPCADQPT